MLAWYVGVAAGVLLVPTWLYLGYLEHEYAQRPQQPRPAQGWTTPYPMKGVTVYVSAREKATTTWLIRIDMGLFAVAAASLFFAAGPLQRREPK